AIVERMGDLLGTSNDHPYLNCVGDHECQVRDSGLVSRSSHYVPHRLRSEAGPPCVDFFALPPATSGGTPRGQLLPFLPTTRLSAANPTASQMNARKIAALTCFGHQRSSK